MCDQNDTAGIEIRQAQRPGEQPPGGLTKDEKQAIKERNKELEQQGRRICHTCGVEQDLEQGFSKQDKGRSYFARCKACSNMAEKLRRRAKTGLKQAPRNGYHRAGTYGRPAVFVPEQEIIEFWRSRGLDENRCAYTQVELTPEPGHSNSRTIDHVQPLSDPESAGHVLENILPCSRDYNRHKSNGNALEKWINRPQDQFPTLYCYVGLGHGHAGVDEHGTPLAPALVEWSDGDSPAIEFTLTEQGAE